MSWFRDYIYIPLGGSRCERWKVIRNTIIVFLLSGLWHGANWTFICWGLYHATLIAIYVMLGANTKPQIEQNKQFSGITDLIQMTATFTLVVIGWIMFRCNDMEQFFNFIKAIVINPIWGKTPTPPTFAYTTLGFILLGMEWLQRAKQHPLEFPCNHLFNSKIIRWSIYVFLFIFIVSSMGENQTFLYFQF
jgi:D-alanyl-lipoteichoic acid acyltransferase DltB (MBOAT superfamily)